MHACPGGCLPDPGLAVEASGHDLQAVRREFSWLHTQGVSFQQPDARPSFPILHPHSLVLAGRDYKYSIGRESSRVDFLCMALQLPCALPCSGVPDSHSLVITGRDNMFPIPAECGCVDYALVSYQITNACTWELIPYFDDLIVTSRYYPLYHRGFISSFLLYENPVFVFVKCLALL